MDPHTTATTVPKEHHGATRQTERLSVMTSLEASCTASHTFLVQQTFLMEIH